MRFLCWWLLHQLVATCYLWCCSLHSSTPPFDMNTNRRFLGYYCTNSKRSVGNNGSCTYGPSVHCLTHSGSQLNCGMSHIWRPCIRIYCRSFDMNTISSTSTTSTTSSTSNTTFTTTFTSTCPCRYMDGYLRKYKQERYCISGCCWPK